MIGTVLRISWINLKRDRIAQALSFILPIVFFSVFAYIFGSQGAEPMKKVTVAVVDQDDTEASRRFVEALKRDGGLKVAMSYRNEPQRRYDREAASNLVREGKLSVAVIVPRGFSESFGDFTGKGPPVELLADRADPVAPQMVIGSLQRAGMTSAPDLMIQRGIDQLTRHGGPLTERQRQAVDSFLPRLRSSGAAESSGGQAEEPLEADPVSADSGSGRGSGGAVPVKVVDVQSNGNEDKTPAISFYAAGTGVMFLLFMVSGAAGTLLEEEESGALERILTSNLGMGRLLIGKWIFIAAAGAVQVTLMFIWGSLVFGLNLWTANHLAGFAAMTIVTAMAAAGFGLVLASACRSRGQLAGISTIVILIMSAVGGSMFPRFMMTEGMQKIGLITFNAWALDGYQKVFWREAAVYELWPQLLVLSGLAVAFLATARLLARRWERV